VASSEPLLSYGGPLCRYVALTGPGLAPPVMTTVPASATRLAKPMNYRLEILTINCVIIMAYMTSA